MWNWLRGRFKGNQSLGDRADASQNRADPSESHTDSSASRTDVSAKPGRPAGSSDQSERSGIVQVTVFEGNAEAWHGSVNTPLEIGRQQTGDDGTFQINGGPEIYRLAVATTSARSLPRRAVRVDLADDGLLRITNTNAYLSFLVGAEASPLRPGDCYTDPLEATVSLPEQRTVRIRKPGNKDGAVSTNKARGRKQVLYGAFEPGKVIGQYVIEEQLGSGGMGVVYLARHQFMNRRVAVKVPPPTFLNDRLLERFRQEVEVTGQLNHPNILRAYDAGIHDGQPYLVVECIHGSTLGEEVRERGPLQIEEVIQYSLQAASGLGYAHANGIVHRDVKPENLMLDENGLLRVIDFGLAATCDQLLQFPPDLLDRELPESITAMDIQEDSRDMAATIFVIPKSLSSTHNSELVGTLAYMSPEQSCAVDIDRRSDIYSLGCAMFFMLTGRQLFPPEAETPRRAGSILLRHRHEPPPKLSSLRPQCSAMLEETVLRMLAKRPEDRYASMGDVVAALREEQAKLGFGNRLFLSYRRDDSFDATHRLYENLTAKFGEKSLIMDIDTIPAGEDFRGFIVESVRRSSALLVVIGDHWLKTQDDAGRRRLDDPRDYLRLEIEIAAEYNKPIIPVLVGRAEMPPADLLPDSLRFLAYRNAAEVRSGRGYADDVSRLISRLEGILAVKKGSS